MDNLIQLELIVYHSDISNEDIIELGLIMYHLHLYLFKFILKG